ncbi:NAD-dependent epimerase/dehydratase family protein [Achromobacter sp. NFACC18-2]|uniref:NAD-dependent epimerase/dehydratase family protein n=1 Tax=Achromobacter sp. NFACC18-2 TaxID=1564112 RepID=UPI000B88B1E6|nr:NAD-dependent epimerase/dehydratase family protein [Achromobacter sp. NFACC18-2]
MTDNTTPLRCLVLGGRGFVGSHLVDGLLAAGHRVRSFGRLHTGHHEPREGLEYFDGNFENLDDVRSALDGCDICYHLISTTLPKSSNGDPCYDIESNLIGTVRLLNAAVDKGVKKIVFTSSGGTVYGNPRFTPIPENHPTDPICSYGITKLAVEKYLEMFRTLHGLEYQVLRLANPYGERQLTRGNQGVVAIFLGKIIRGECVEVWGDGSSVRDYLHISDVTRALIRSIDPGATPERVLNIGSGIGVSVNELLESIESVTGRVADRKYLPPRAFDVPSNVLDISAAYRSLGWAPQVPFIEGISRFARWLADNPHAI